jgi:hypothetical protein
VHEGSNTLWDEHVPKGRRLVGTHHRGGSGTQYFTDSLVPTDRTCINETPNEQSHHRFRDRAKMPEIALLNCDASPSRTFSINPNLR